MLSYVFWSGVVDQYSPKKYWDFTQENYHAIERDCTEHLHCVSRIFDYSCYQLIRDRYQ